MFSTKINQETKFIILTCKCLPVQDCKDVFLGSRTRSLHNQIHFFDVETCCRCKHHPLTTLLTYFVHRIASSSTCSLHSALVDRKEKLSFQIICLEIDWLFTCSAHFDKSMTSSVLSSCIIYQPKILAGISFYFLYAMH